MLFVRQVAAHVLGHGVCQFVRIGRGADPPIREAPQDIGGKLPANNLRLAVLGRGLQHKDWPAARLHIVNEQVEGRAHGRTKAALFVLRGRVADIGGQLPPGLPPPQ